MVNKGTIFLLGRDGIVKVNADEPTAFLPCEYSWSGCDCDLGDIEEESQIAPFWTEDDVIYTYTRAQAIDDGYLVDVTLAARKHGFRYPVAIALEAYTTCVEWAENSRDGLNIKKTDNRLDSLLSLVADRVVTALSDRLYFDFLYEDRETFTTATANLVSICGPGDTGEPVVTIMFPHEE